MLALTAHLLFFIRLSLALFNRVEGINDLPVTKVAVLKNDPSRVWVLTDKTLYLSEDNGLTFQIYTRLIEEVFTHLFVQNASTFYFSDTHHIYREGEQLDLIYTANDETIIHYLSEYNDTLFAATSDGLYKTPTSQRIWERVAAFKDDTLFHIEPTADALYLISESGLYRLHQEGNVEQLFATRYRAEFSEETESKIKLHTFKMNLLNPNHLWLGTSKGLFESFDRGVTWQPRTLPAAGRPSIYHLAQNEDEPNTLYLSTQSGLYAFDLRRGEIQTLYSGLPTTQTHWIAFDASGHLYLATDKGLYKSDSKVQQAPLELNANPISLKRLLQKEPPIYKVHEAALRYNSVHPDKIAAWRKRIKYRALLPEVTLDYDKTIGSSFTQSGHYYAEGPNDWGLNLKWDMGDLLWNSAENIADTRSRLTTQLRLDILDDVNRLYYERLRLKHELQQLSDTEERFSTELRLHEITAALDGYTGGDFSRSTPSD